MGGGHANSRLEPQHHSVQSNKLHTILVNVCGRGSATKGDKTLKLANYNRDPACPNEAKEKDLLESDRLKVIANLQIYQEETRIWRDPKVNMREFDVGNLVLLRSPRTENTGKFEAKWT
jgi:hypothetical protein